MRVPHHQLVEFYYIGHVHLRRKKSSAALGAASPAFILRAASADSHRACWLNTTICRLQPALAATSMEERAASGAEVLS